MINVATAGIEAEAGRVTVFTPVFPKSAYRFGEIAYVLPTGKLVHLMIETA